MLATRLPDLAAAVPFYGSAAQDEAVAQIKAPLLIHYAENDERINAGAAGYEAALKATHVNYQVFIYPGTQHGFNNDTTPALRQSGRDARVAAHHRLLQEEPIVGRIRCDNSCLGIFTTERPSLPSLTS